MLRNASVRKEFIKRFYMERSFIVVPGSVREKYDQEHEVYRLPLDCLALPVIVRYQRALRNRIIFVVPSIVVGLLYHLYLISCRRRKEPMQSRWPYV